MTDIVSRLRAIDEERQHHEPWTCEQVAKEAAHEIERLRAGILDMDKAMDAGDALTATAMLAELAEAARKDEGQTDD